MTGAWHHKLDLRVDSVFDRMVEIRRHLHRYPEVSGEEYKTSLYLYQLLGDAGFEVRLGPEGRGVIADSGRSDEVTGAFAMRADLDGLRIHDEKQVSYRSQHAGVMHACGHDAHTAIVSGALLALRQSHLADELPCSLRIRGVYQPAEETCEGAKAMLAAGALDGVQAILSTHVDPALPLRKVGVRSGVLTANCDEMHITITGHGGHAARPHLAQDPISASAQLVNWLYSQIPRATDSQEAVVVTIGTLKGGHTSNVIPERVDLSGTMRTLDVEVRDETMRQIQRLAQAVADGSGTVIEVTYGVGAPSVVNDVGIIQMVTDAVRGVLGEDGIHWIPRPSMGSEDFAFYAAEVPGGMFRLGCATDEVGGAGLHTPTFDIDEEALRIGAKVMARSVVAWCEANLG